jgi:hypothetical protein
MTIEEPHYSPICNYSEQTIWADNKDLDLKLIWDEEDTLFISNKRCSPLTNGDDGFDDLSNYVDIAHVSILDSPKLKPYSEFIDHPKDNQYVQFNSALIQENTILYPKPTISNCRKKRHRTGITFSEFQYLKSNAAVNDGVAEYQPKRFPEDMYTPSWLRGKGNYREGLCSICNPPIWFKMKQSAYW